jgi:hypothetical protein
MLESLKRRAMKCSFCGKSADEVQKLIAGRKVYICDACVETCNKILDALPVAFAGWGSMSDTQLLDALEPSATTLEAVRAVLQQQVDELRARQVSWDAIGKALGHLAPSGVGALLLARLHRSVDQALLRRHQAAAASCAAVSLQHGRLETRANHARICA